MIEYQGEALSLLLTLCLHVLIPRQVCLECIGSVLDIVELFHQRDHELSLVTPPDFRDACMGIFIYLDGWLGLVLMHLLLVFLHLVKVLNKIYIDSSFRLASLVNLDDLDLEWLYNFLLLSLLLSLRLLSK